MPVTNEIEKLDKCLKDFCRPIYSRLNNPLNEKDVYLFLEKWGFKDSKLHEIFLWKNGLDYDDIFPTNAFDFTGFGVLPSLQYVETIMNIPSLRRYWSKSQFPLIVSFAGDFLLYESDNEKKDYGRIYLQSPNLGYVETLVEYFDDIKSMFQTIIKSFEEKIFIYHEENMNLEINYDKYFLMAAQNNPESLYWK